MRSVQRLEHFSVHFGILDAAAVVEPATWVRDGPGDLLVYQKGRRLLDSQLKGRRRP